MKDWLNTTIGEISLGFDLLSPLPRLQLERQMHSDEDCSRIENPSSAVTTQMRRAYILLLAEGNKWQRGALLFGYFVLGKQNKVTGLKAKSNKQKRQQLWL